MEKLTKKFYYLQIKNLYNEKEELMVANKSLAEYNLSQEPVLNAKRQQLTAKHREAVQLVEAVKQAKSELEQKSGKIQPDSLYYLLEVTKFVILYPPQSLNPDFLCVG